MNIYRTELESGISQKLFDINAEKFNLEEIEFFSKNINGTISVDTLSNGYHVKGNLKIPYKLTCDRCLTKFKDLKNIKFNFILTDDEELNYDDSDDVVYFSNSKDEFDLNPMFQEYIFLAIQMKILCKDSCKGLCINCGTNLNKIKCNCSDNKDIGPWDKLKNLNRD
jgi:uncharacterized protein